MNSRVLLAAFVPLLTPALAEVVINEVHYDPVPANDPVEFVELHNPGPAAVDLAGWAFTEGITFAFPAGSKIEADGYAVVVADVAKFTTRFGSLFAGGITPAGQYIGQLSNGGEKLTLRDAAGVARDEVDYQDAFPWPVGAGAAVGSSMELIHPKLDNSLGGNWRSSAVNKPTPGARNSVFAESAPPVIRQVEHAPKAPKPGESVTITAHINDPEGVKAATLRYQQVKPGEYIHLKDAAYETNWADIAMRDDGASGDAQASDDIYTAVVPGASQIHRHLLRYRIAAEDQGGATVRVPYADDGQPNFAYFCYGALPAWSGAVKAGDPVVTYGPELLQTVPVYHVITTRQHHVDAQFIPGTTRSSGYTGSDYLWGGTLVYDGEVYDHIKFRARGGVWRYAMGKNMWKFLFNRGREFEARDQQGEKYPSKWRRLNFSSLIQQGDFKHRGEQGLFESVGFNLFNKAGIAAPRTHYVHYRIIENAAEEGVDQYSSDFQGLYLAVEQIDNRFLSSHDLPSGNIYKMESGTGLRGLGGELKNLAPAPAVADYTDLEAFKKTYEKSSPKPTEDWWRANFELEPYYNYRAIVEAIRHGDIGNGKNYFYYHNPETKRWRTLPWDLDLTWDDGMYGDGNEPFKSRVLVIEPFKIAYQNRVREIRDLLYNEEQTGMMIDEYAAIVYTPGKPSLVDADRAMWDYNPLMKSKQVNPSKSGHGLYYKQATTKDFPGMVQRMKNYVIKRSGVMDRLAPEANAPATPTVTHVSSTYVVDNLRFETSDFAGNSTLADQQFAAMKWRIAEITDTKATDFSAAYPNAYEWDAAWESEEQTAFTKAVTIPSSVVKPDRAYRVRVKMKNTLGYWSHWSPASQFVTKAPDLQPYRDNLMLSEIMYQPAPATAEELAKGFASADFEFIELANLGGQELDLTHLRFTKGIDYDFAHADVKTLAAGQRGLLVRDKAAFLSRYGAGALILGQYKVADGNKLDDNGEQLKLSYGGGILLRELDFRDAAPWPVLQPGYSLVLASAEQRPDHALPASWRTSAQLGGSPGVGETAAPPASTYASWAASQFNATQLVDDAVSGPLADPDHDNWQNVFEYLLLGNPLAGDHLGPKLSSAKDANGRLTLTVHARAIDLPWRLEASRDLRAWATVNEASATLVSTVTNGDGSSTRTYTVDPRQPWSYRAVAIVSQ